MRHNAHEPDIGPLVVKGDDLSQEEHASIQWHTFPTSNPFRPVRHWNITVIVRRQTSATHKRLFRSSHYLRRGDPLSINRRINAPSCSTT